MRRETLSYRLFQIFFLFILPTALLLDGLTRAQWTIEFLYFDGTAQVGNEAWGFPFPSVGQYNKIGEYNYNSFEVQVNWLYFIFNFLIKIGVGVLAYLLLFRHLHITPTGKKILGGLVLAPVYMYFGGMALLEYLLIEGIGTFQYMQVLEVDFIWWETLKSVVS